jgi:hypothetical protein
MWLAADFSSLLAVLPMIASPDRTLMIIRSWIRGTLHARQASRVNDLNDSRSERPIGLASSRKKRTSCRCATP